jgi:hypothetical protein
MNIDEARVLRDALTFGIEQAEAAGSTDVDVAGTLDASLSTAIAELQAAIDAKSAG